jgi:dihydrofolate reductase
MRVTLIAAVSRDGFISAGRGIPWSLPEDVRQFREYCEGKWLLLGRRTFEEMQGWFRPGQTPVVVTRQPGYHVPGGHAAGAVESALEMARSAGASECVVIGGGEIFAAALPFADTIQLTIVDTHLHHGVAFPAVAEDQWRICSSRHHPADAAHAFSFAIRRMERARTKKAGALSPGLSCEW